DVDVADEELSQELVDKLGHEVKSARVTWAPMKMNSKNRVVAIRQEFRVPRGMFSPTIPVPPVPPVAPVAPAPPAPPAPHVASADEAMAAPVTAEETTVDPAEADDKGDKDEHES